jgi:Na+/H+ antiporter NhaD/arsenite permease-like protein
MSWAIALIFGLTYALIAARRLAILPIGRPAGALAGAVAMVAVGALTPEQSFAAIDYDTLALLLGMMLLSVYLERSGSFARLTAGLLRRFNRPMSLLMALSVGAAGLSAFLVNDTVCLFATPLVVRICVAARLPFSPFLLALASSANIGSAATLVGNPQNMIIGGMSGLGFLPFMTAALPAVAVALAINLGLLWALFRGRLPATMPTVTLASAASDGRLGSTMVVMTGVIAGLFAGLHPGYVALGGAVLLMLRDREEPNEVFLRVDWSLLLFFAALFVVVAGARSTGVIEALWAVSKGYVGLDVWSGLVGFAALVTAGSNLLSNVPFVLIMGEHAGELGAGALPWVMLAFVSTIAGNLTLLGSVANIIVAEGARGHYQLGFWEYLRFGALSTALTLAGGVATLWWWLG